MEVFSEKLLAQMREKYQLPVGYFSYKFDSVMVINHNEVPFLFC
jgi:hypothetical protein